jgi:anti-anti-sigma factor
VAYQEQSVTGSLKACTRFSVLELEGTLRAPLNGELRQQVEVLLGRNERRILVNLARLSAIDAAGVGALVDAYVIASRAGGVLRVSEASWRVRRLLDVAGVLDLLSPMPHDAGEAA